jgi:hypothetical protein
MPRSELAVKDQFKRYSQVAEHLFYERGIVMPFIFLLADQTIVIPLVEDKDLVTEEAKSACAEFHPDAAIIVAEAWMAKRDHWDGTPVSQLLDRQEILQVILFTRRWGNSSCVWKIHRDPDRLEAIDYGDVSGYRCRFFGDYFQVDA